MLVYIRLNTFVFNATHLKLIQNKAYGHNAKQKIAYVEGISVAEFNVFYLRVTSYTTLKSIAYRTILAKFGDSGNNANTVAPRQN